MGWYNIYVQESKILGRPLNGIDKVRVTAKQIFIISWVILIPHFLYKFSNADNVYDVPREMVFENVSFRVERSSKIRYINLYNGKIRIFSSDCRGLDTVICNKSEYLDVQPTTSVRVIEVGPEDGIIKEMVISTPNGGHKITNPIAEHYARNYASNYYSFDKIVLFFTVVSGAAFLASKTIARTSRKVK